MRMLLIVKENMGLQRFQYSAFIHAAQEMGFVNSDIPAAERMDHPAVRRGTAGGNNGSFEKTFILRVALFPFIFQSPQVTQFAEKIAQWAGGDGSFRIGGFGIIKCFDTFGLENLFGTVIGDHSVKVKCHPQFGITGIII